MGSNISLAATSTPGFAGQNVCDRLTGFISKMETRVAEREQKITSRKQEKQEKWSDKAVQWDEKREEKRQQAETRQSEFLTRLENQAQTEAQKQAVVNFRTAVQAAIEARKKAVDDAIKAFRSGVDQMLQARKTSTDALVTVFKAAQKSAFDKAKSSCGSGIEPKTILETLKTELKAAQDKFQSDRQAIEKAAEQVKTLNQTKKNAFEKAHQDFKTALEKAKADLKAAFPQPTPGISSAPVATPTP